MLRVAVGFMLLCALLTLFNIARAESLFQKTLKLRTGQLLVVEESALEPRSIGSYSLRLYSGERPEFPYDRFVTGLVQARDGVLEAALELDLRYCDSCVVICLRSAGSGGYLTRHVFSYSDQRLELRSAQSLGPAEVACDDVGDMRAERAE